MELNHDKARFFAFRNELEALCLKYGVHLCGRSDYQLELVYRKWNESFISPLLNRLDPNDASN